MLRTNMISLAAHATIVFMFFLFNCYINYLAGVFAALRESYAPYLIYVILSLVAYFFIGFFIGSLFRLRGSGLKNVVAVSGVAVIGISLWMAMILYSGSPGMIRDGLEWMLYTSIFMHFTKLLNSIHSYIIPQFFYITIAFLPTVFMWAGIEYKASIFKRMIKA